MIQQPSSVTSLNDLTRKFVADFVEHFKDLDKRYKRQNYT